MDWKGRGRMSISFLIITIAIITSCIKIIYNLWYLYTNNDKITEVKREERVSRLIEMARHSLSEDWMKKKGKKKKKLEAENRITIKKKKKGGKEGNMHGFNLLNALARNRRTKRTHVSSRSFASISFCATGCTRVYCHSLSLSGLAFSTSHFLSSCSQSIRTLERALPELETLEQFVYNPHDDSRPRI